MKKSLQSRKSKNTYTYLYGNASREKTVKSARLKMFEIIDKSLSELLKKTANQKKVWFLSYIDSKKRIFPRRLANGVAPTVRWLSQDDQCGANPFRPSGKKTLPGQRLNFSVFF